MTDLTDSIECRTCRVFTSFFSLLQINTLYTQSLIARTVLVQTMDSDYVEGAAGVLRESLISLPCLTESSKAIIVINHHEVYLL